MKEPKELWNNVPSVFCEVLLSGRIIEGEKGYRAEKMQIVSIINSYDISFDTVKILADKYAIPITDRKDVRVFIHNWVNHVIYGGFLFIGIMLLYMMPLMVTTVFIRPNIAEPVYTTDKYIFIAIIGVPIAIVWYTWQGSMYFIRNWKHTKVKHKTWEPTI